MKQKILRLLMLSPSDILFHEDFFILKHYLEAYVTNHLLLSSGILSCGRDTGDKTHPSLRLLNKEKAKAFVFDPPDAYNSPEMIENVGRMSDFIAYFLKPASLHLLNRFPGCLSALMAGVT